MSASAPLPASVLLVGCGRMGGALLAGWREHVPVSILDPQAPDTVDAPRLASPQEAAGLPAPRVMVIAVKPGLVAGVLETFRPLADADTLFLSVAAGVRIETLLFSLGEGARVARAMPNIGVAKGAGATAIAFGPELSEAQRSYCEALFRLVGEVVLLGDERLIDVATAISGSGPAYFFRFGEALAAAGREAGLTDADAHLLAQATLRGAGALCDGSASLADLRSAVTSPGGTTAAALERLGEDGRIDRLAADAVAAAIRRSGELGG